MYVLQMLLKKENNELDLEEEKHTAQGVTRGEFIQLVHHIDNMATNVTVMRQFVSMLQKATNPLLDCAWKVRRVSGYVQPQTLGDLDHPDSVTGPRGLIEWLSWSAVPTGHVSRGVQ